MKEIILEVRMAYMEFNAEAVARLENRNKVSFNMLWLVFVYEMEYYEISPLSSWLATCA